MDWPLPNIPGLLNCPVAVVFWPNPVFWPNVFVGCWPNPACCCGCWAFWFGCQAFPVAGLKRFGCCWLNMNFWRRFLEIKIALMRRNWWMIGIESLIRTITSRELLLTELLQFWLVGHFLIFNAQVILYSPSHSRFSARYRLIWSWFHPNYQSD